MTGSRSELRRQAATLGGPAPEFDTDLPAAPGGCAAGSSVAAPGPSQATSGDGPAPRTWEIALPPRLKILNMNDRDHWAAKNRVFQSLKSAAWAMTLNARIPRLERVAVRVVYDPPDLRRRDPDNLVVKPLIDGIVAARVIPDDNSRHVASVTCEIGTDVAPGGRLRIFITEAPADSSTGEAA